MPKGGWLSITTRIEGGQAVIEVGDTGAGIPADHLSRIYDPFFTTKPIGQGTGLGLSITYGIVRENGGVITCESAEGKGTMFRLLFPLAQDGAALRAMRRDETADSEPPAPTPATSTETGGLMTRHGSILVIDDEEIMREILETLLVREGYQVRLATQPARRASSWRARCRSTPPSST